MANSPSTEERIERLTQLTEASAAKAADIHRVSGKPDRNRLQLIELLDQVSCADIPAEQQRRLSSALLELIEHEQMEERMGLLLTKCDAAFMKALHAKHPNLTLRENIICLFVKLGYGTREIARRVGISTRGMESIRYRLHKKIGRGNHESMKTYFTGIEIAGR